MQEIIVTGSRIAAPNEVSTSPIEVLSSKYIEVSGKTDINDLLMQLPPNFNNSLGQDLGNTTSGLTTAGGVATADLRGLAGANNVLDKDPPIIDNNIVAGSAANTYDAAVSCLWRSRQNSDNGSICVRKGALFGSLKLH